MDCNYYSVRVCRFEADHVLVEADAETHSPAITMPEGKTKNSFIEWASNLPSTQSPTWIGLPTNAEMVLLTNQSKVLIINMRKLQVDLQSHHTPLVIVVDFRFADLCFLVCLPSLT